MSVGSDTQAGVRARSRGRPGEAGLAVPVLPGRARPGSGQPGRPVPGRQPPGPGRTAAPGAGRPAAPRTGRGAGPDRGAGNGLPRRPAPARRTGWDRQAGRWATGPSAAIARTPFILFVTGLLGGGLICLLVINTILASGSYEINSLQQAQAARQQQVQTLQQQIATDSAPSVIASRAKQLGMVDPPLTSFLNLRTGRLINQPTAEPGVPAVPGYVP